MNKQNCSLMVAGMLLLAACSEPATNNTETMTFTGAPKEVKIITLDPGHFHAALVQKFPYEQVDSVVHIYAPDGPDLQGHLQRINSYNNRADNPTNWDTKLHTGTDFLEQMVADKAGNVVVISGKNARKTEYIQTAIENGLNVLADKPMVIKPADFTSLQSIFQTAEEKGVLLYDIMTERYEITTILQKELAHIPAVFGTMENGTPEEPAITKESVHHFFKYVSGSPLIRPAWFFDVEQQGEGVVDVSTHLVDLVFWECFPEQVIDYGSDIEMIQARRWATELTPSQFEGVTGLDEYPDYLQKDLKQDSILQTYSNGEIIFTVNGVHAKVSVIWNYVAPEGAGDTHYSIMRGTKANLVIRQGAEQNFKPALYVEPVEGQDRASYQAELENALQTLSQKYPGLSLNATDAGWQVMIPEEYKVGHEAHFSQVTEKYLEYLVAGKLPDWEVPNMLAKYYVTTKGYELSR